MFNKLYLIQLVDLDIFSKFVKTLNLNETQISIQIK